MSAYYNEIDPGAAEWLRELIKGGHIAPGDVDERSIEDVRPDDLRGYDQCHFFAGIGGWSLALRLAGWPDDRPVWTGSCPCQPFSAAGKGGGFDDERHLWPAWHHLIRIRRPPVVFGEQVASKDGLLWLDLVQADLEGEDYACGAGDLCSAGFGAPHIRQRLDFVAHDLRSAAGGVQYAPRDRRQEWRAEPGGRSASGGCGTDGLADGDDAGLEGRREPERERAAQCLAGPGGVAGGLADGSEFGRVGRRAGETGDEPGAIERPDGLRYVGGVGNACRTASERDARSVSGAKTAVHGARVAVDGGMPVGPEYASPGVGARPMPTNEFWRDADWLLCTDGKWRPVEPGTFPLAHGVPGRVGLLRGYGNAINPRQHAAFVEAYLEREVIDI